MRRLLLGAMIGALVASQAYGDQASGEASAPPPPAPRLMLFSGFDGWRDGAFSYGGLLWAPAALDRDGFVLKAFGGSGGYRYFAGGAGQALAVEVIGEQRMFALLPGWRFKRDALEVTLFAGLDLQEHRLTPDDPASRVRGAHAGLRVGADAWYQPSRAIMLAASASLAAVGTGYWARGAAGVRLLDRVWLGPEIVALGDARFWQGRLGAHATGLRTGRFEWSIGSGLATDSDRRRGWYGHLGVLLRY